MKKIFTLAFVALFSVSMMAQHEIGGIVGGLNGLSYKYWISDNLALQADLAVGLTAGYGGAYFKGNKFGEGELDIYDFTINPNLAYHFDLPSNFKLYLGGGINFGMMSDINNTNTNGILGKFGANGIVGAAYHLGGVPLVLALDFRPGYGLGFQDKDAAHLSFFDWKLGFAVRYAL